jgi:hypothetical protein
MKYVVTYEETLARTLIVEADSYADAQDKMMIAVETGVIELTADDYVDGCVPYIDKASENDEEFFVNLDSLMN